MPVRRRSEGFDVRQPADAERFSRTGLLVDGAALVGGKAHRGTPVGITFFMATVVAVTTASACSWAHPGANPYRGDPLSALSDFAIPDETRRQLRMLMAAHRFTDVATITRDAIVGQQRYEGLREMHSGHGQTCHGAVDRSAWSDQLKERGLVYCAGDTCVIVPTICNNVSLVTRKPDELAPAAEDQESIDISPAAGPPPPVAASPSSQDGDVSALDFFPVPASEGGSFVADFASDGSGAGVGGASGSDAGGGGPIASGPLGAPVSPTLPTDVQASSSLPTVSAVPETATSMLMLIGLVSLVTYQRAGKRRSMARGR